MPENETKAKRTNNNKIITCIGVLIVIAGLVIGAILALNSQTINDSFFEPNDHKYVLTRTSEDGGDFGELKAHTVANVDGDDIKSLTIYYEFESSNKAKENFSEIDTIYRDGSADSIKNVSMKDKYVIVEYADSEYANMSASDFKAWIDFYQEAENTDYEYWEEDEITDGSTESAEPTSSEE